jgi:cobalt/nickel transport protein
MKKSNRWVNIGILFTVALLIVLPLAFVKGTEFGGADGAAEEAITQINPDYKPWAAPLLEPPGSETEGLLFALQAALGAGVIGYGIGYYKGRAMKRERSDEHSY